MGEHRTSRVQMVVVVMTLVVAIVGVYLVVREQLASFRAQRQRTVFVGGEITVRPQFDEPLTILVEYVDAGGRVQKYSSKVLQDGRLDDRLSGGLGGGRSVRVGETAPAGMTIRLRFGINADIVGVFSDGTRSQVLQHDSPSISEGTAEYFVLTFEKADPKDAVVQFDCPRGQLELVVERVGDRLLVRKVEAGK